MTRWWTAELNYAVWRLEVKHRRQLNDLWRRTVRALEALEKHR